MQVSRGRPGQWPPPLASRTPSPAAKLRPSKRPILAHPLIFPAWMSTCSNFKVKSNINDTNIILQSKISVIVKQCCKQTEWKHCCQCVAGATLKSILSVSSCQDQVVACSVACQCVADAIQVVDFISVITNCVKYGSLLTDPFLQTI